MISLDGRFDGVAAGYLAEMERLAGLALAGALPGPLYALAQEALAWNTITAVFLLSGADPRGRRARPYLLEQRRIARASARALAADLVGGRYEGLEGVNGRLHLWVYTLAGVYQRGLLLRPVAAGEREEMWRCELGGTELHCRHCLDYDGAIMSSSEWLLVLDAGFGPQGKNNECGGWRCDCRLVRWEPAGRD